MSIEDYKKRWEKEQPQLGSHINELILRMFNKGGDQFFDERTFDLDLVKQFMIDKDVQYHAYFFASTIKMLWAAKFPGQKKIEPRGWPDLNLAEKIDGNSSKELRSMEVQKTNSSTNSSATNLPILSTDIESTKNVLASQTKVQGAGNDGSKMISTEVALIAMSGINKQKNENPVQVSSPEKQKSINDSKVPLKTDSKLSTSPPKTSTNVPILQSASDNNVSAQNKSSSPPLIAQPGTSSQTGDQKISAQSPTVVTNSAGVTSNVNTLKPGQIPSAHSKPAVVSEVKPTFHLPNCNVGLPFKAKVEATHRSGKSVFVINMKIPDGLGLSFIRESQMVNGIPLLSGEIDLELEWKFTDTPGNRIGMCRLTSNPDPKSLWKVIEPSSDLPYRKAHLDYSLLKAKEFCIAAASRRGRSHEHAGSFRDDDFFIHHDQSTGWSILVAADGAGSSKNSREGSRIAVESSGKFLVDNLLSDIGQKISVQLPAWDSRSTSQEIIGTEFHYLFHKMALQAIKNIEHEAESKNIPFKEYSTTLLATAVKRDGANTFVASFWIGDGAIAAYGPRGTVKLMGIPDGGEFAGQTRFLDRNTINDPSFSKRVHVGRFLDATAVILLTDGVSDPYFETDSGLLNASNWDLLWDEIRPFLKDARPEYRLVEWLHFFKQGHHDDRTIAILW
jgi:hypothetical protein